MSLNGDGTPTAHVLQMDAALAHVVIVAALRTATPLRTVVKVTRVGAGQRSARPSA